MTKHKHAEIIKAWADGAEIECRSQAGPWALINMDQPIFYPDLQYRIKPTPRVARRWWANVYDNLSTINNRSGYLYDTKEIADTKASINRLECIEVIEILPEEDAT